MVNIKLPFLSQGFPNTECTLCTVDGRKKWVVFSDVIPGALILGMDEQQDKAIEQASDYIAIMNSK